ncbi:hypothetical protein CDL12_24554 [Handroanthus impetiginosus]|uniref:Uncharacterized protein n=1 Tax=Handroanthus impetiginosus TaxID=429701 RepID=A0A2G9GCB1_9LAMI|nr:hypothetical protein CDL12_24554 [Handroanthus impetiginosus]
MIESHKSLNINDEYLCAVRTKSYAEFFLKAQLLVNEQPTSSSPAYRHSKLSEVLLDPGQETITEVLESSNKSSDLKALLFDFFNVSAEASNFCSHLLKSLNQIRTDYKFVHQVLDTTIKDDEQFDSILSKLSILEDPFGKQDFSQIHEKHSSVLQHLKSKRKRVTRKIKLINYFNKISGVCVTAACGLVVAAAVALAAHTLTVLLMGPTLISLPVKPLKKKFLDIRFLKSEFLRKIREQLDVAAKGTYILNRDFDTMSRLVSRLQDEIEHNNAMIKFCLDRREDKLSVEVLKELKKGEFGFMKQLEELEEHVYLCLVTINRARALVIKEISTFV